MAIKHYSVPQPVVEALANKILDKGQPIRRWGNEDGYHGITYRLGDEEFLVTWVGETVVEFVAIKRNWEASCLS